MPILSPLPLQGEGLGRGRLWGQRCVQLSSLPDFSRLHGFLYSAPSPDPSP